MLQFLLWAMIATRYGLDGLRMKFLLGDVGSARFSTPMQTNPGAHAVSYAVGTRSFTGLKWLGHGINHPPPSSSEVKERVDMYINSLSLLPW